MTNPCCEKCETIFIPPLSNVCSDWQCACHKSAENNYFETLKEPALKFDAPTDTSEEWKGRFEKLWSQKDSSGNKGLVMQAFIASEKQRSFEEGRDDKRGHGDAHREAFRKGRSVALEEVKQLLEAILLDHLKTIE